MLETIAILLVILWVLGLVSSYTLGGFIHILLVIAVIVLILRVIQGRSVLQPLPHVAMQGVLDPELWRIASATTGLSMPVNTGLRITPYP